MAFVNLVGTVVPRALDANGAAVSGALLYVYREGTTTAVTTYTDATGATPNAHPVVADANGAFSGVYVAPQSVKVDLQTPAGSSLPGYPVDNIDLVPSNGINIAAFGATEGASDISSAVSDAISALPAAGGRVFLPPGSYTWATKIAPAIPEDTELDFTGCTITCTHNDIALAIQDTWNPAAPTVIRRVTITGGHWKNTNATKTASTAIRAYGMRRFIVQRAYFTGFWKAVEFSAKDTYIFRDCFFFDNLISIHNPTLATDSGDKTVLVFIDKCHFSINGETNGILIEDSLATININDSSFNGACSAGQIKFNDHTLTETTQINITNNSFEQIDANGAIVFSALNGLGFRGVMITGNSFRSSTLGWKGIITDDCQGLTIASLFTDGSGGGTEVAITLDADSRDIDIEDGLRWSGATHWFSNVATPVDLNGCSRSNVVMHPQYISVPGLGINDGTTNLDPLLSQSTFGPTTIDMSAVHVTIANSALPPVSYEIGMTANDSNSSPATGIFVRMHETGGTVNRALRIDLGGVPNDDERTAHGVVLADANGDIDIRAIAGAASSMDIRAWLLGIYR